MFGHVYGADCSGSALEGLVAGRHAGRRRFRDAGRPAAARGTVLEAEQRAYVDGLTEADLERLVDLQEHAGRRGSSVALGPLLQHVVNHATHHRSEVATMITLASGSPPDTGIATYRTTVVKG